MTSLKEVYIGKSRMTSDVSRAVLLGLSRCRLLEKAVFWRWLHERYRPRAGGGSVRKPQVSV